MRMSMKTALYQDFSPQNIDFVNRNAFLITKLMSNLPNFRVIQALIAYASQSTFVQVSYCYLYLILHKFWSVLTCDILGISLF